MGKRIFSTFLLWGIVGGSHWFFRTTGALVLITLISVLTLAEFYELMRASGYQPFLKLGLVAGAIITIAPAFAARIAGLGSVSADAAYTPIGWPSIAMARASRSRLVDGVMSGTEVTPRSQSVCSM